MFSFGVSDVYVRYGGVSGDTIKIDSCITDKNTEVSITATTEVAEFKGHGCMGAVEARISDVVMSATVPMVLDIEKAKELFPDIMQDGSTAAQAKMVNPVNQAITKCELLFQPRGATDDSKNLYFPAVIPYFDVNILLTADGTSTIPVTFLITGKDADGVEVDPLQYGVAMPVEQV